MGGKSELLACKSLIDIFFKFRIRDIEKRTEFVLDISALLQDVKKILAFVFR